MKSDELEPQNKSHERKLTRYIPTLSKDQEIVEVNLQQLENIKIEDL